MRIWCRVLRAALAGWRGQRGLTMVEYGVMAAFVVLILTGVALVAGPKLGEWMKETLCGIMNKAPNCMG